MRVITDVLKTALGKAVVSAGGEIEGEVCRVQIPWPRSQG